MWSPSCRHYHKALTSERRYHQLLSSTSSSSIITDDHTHNSRDHAPSSHVRRKLSAAFSSIQQHRQHQQSSSDKDINMDPLQGSEVVMDPLQCSTESVFTMLAPEDEARYKLPSNWEQPASPQVVLRRQGRPNPLTSHTSHSLTTSSSSFTTRLCKQSSGDAPASILPSHTQHAFFNRRPSAPLSAPSWNSGPLNSGGTGPLSPLATGHKSRTPSGRKLH